MSRDSMWVFFNDVPEGTKFKLGDTQQPIYMKTGPHQATRRTDPWGLGLGKSIMVLDGHTEILPVNVRECYWCRGEFGLIDLVFVPREGETPHADPQRFLCAGCETDQHVDKDKP